MFVDILVFAFEGAKINVQFYNIIIEFLYFNNYDVLLR